MWVVAGSAGSGGGGCVAVRGILANAWFALLARAEGKAGAAETSPRPNFIQVCKVPLTIVGLRVDRR